MTEQLPKEERFHELPVPMDGFSTEYFVNEYGKHVVIISDNLEGGDLRLYVKEARGLRDWLNKVIP